MAGVLTPRGATDPAPALTGLVLAGGGGRRMGRDKAVLEVGGQRLVDVVHDRLATICERVLVASGDGHRLEGPWEQVADVTPDAGPLAGILAGLQAASTPLVAVVAVDMPWCDPGLLMTLREQWTGEIAALIRYDGRLEPLHALYARDGVERIQAAFDGGERSPSRLLERLDPLVVTVIEAPFARDLDTPEDLDAARRGT